jgi:enoyl-CoA hydratase/carnithine racemase
MMTGRRIDVAEADRLGCVTRAVPVDEPRRRGGRACGVARRQVASRIMRLGRDSFYAVWVQGAADALRFLHPLLTVTTATEDSAEGITAFIEKREPRWSGR